MLSPDIVQHNGKLLIDQSGHKEMGVGAQKASAL